MAHNSLVNNQTGIVILGYTVGSTLIESNSIVDSAIAAMDLQCARGGATVKQNSIFNAPVAFVNAPPDKSAGFRLSGNVLYKVTAATSSTSTCYGS